MVKKWILKNIIMKVNVVYNNCDTKKILIEEHGEESVEWIEGIKTLISDYMKTFNSPPPIGMYFTLRDCDVPNLCDYEPLKVDAIYFSNKNLEICLSL